MWKAIAIDKNTGEIIERREEKSFTSICVYAICTETDEIEVKIKEEN